MHIFSFAPEEGAARHACMHACTFSQAQHAPRFYLAPEEGAARACMHPGAPEEGAARHACACMHTPTHAAARCSSTCIWAHMRLACVGPAPTLKECTQVCPHRGLTDASCSTAACVGVSILERTCVYKSMHACMHIYVLI